MPQQPPTIRIQIVLHRQKLADVWRVYKGIAACVEQSLRVGAISTCTVKFGDSSPAPAMHPGDADALRTSIPDSSLEVTYEWFGANLGSAGGSNRLAEAAGEDFILVLNPDTYPAPTLLSELLSVFGDASVGAADAHQIPLQHPKDFDLATGDTSWGSGSCLLVRTDVFHAVGGFDDEHFFLYCDDVDFSWRIRLHGLRVVHVPSAVVFHDKRIQLSGTIKPTPLEDFYGTLGRLMLARKYDRPDIVTQTIAHVDSAGSDDQRRAIEEWRARLERGAAPEPLAGAERVAQFIDGEYARHRF